ncbi:hypothetical protein cand_004050 [Cryptosporidium andersoni]|uniref:ELM2 domain-containing protein n=1 Tax=Cryptosporidium andersoni TaxID=117008 RepID=A0A1J4MNV8_9CRYT|nr:hypothetical protein cand_004050 [Cryptosporidium andersoni]
MSGSEWMKCSNTTIRVGPQYQAVIPDLISGIGKDHRQTDNVKPRNINSDKRNLQCTDNDESLPHKDEKKAIPSTNIRIIKLKTRSNSDKDYNEQKVTNKCTKMNKNEVSE